MLLKGWLSTWAMDVLTPFVIPWRTLENFSKMFTLLLKMTYFSLKHSSWTRQNMLQSRHSSNNFFIPLGDLFTGKSITTTKKKVHWVTVVNSHNSWRVDPSNLWTLPSVSNLMWKTLYCELAVFWCFHFSIVFSRIQNILPESSVSEWDHFLPSLSLTSSPLLWWVLMGCHPGFSQGRGC